MWFLWMEFEIVSKSNSGHCDNIMNVLRFSKCVPTAKVTCEMLLDTYSFSSEEMSYDIF